MRTLTLFFTLCVFLCASPASAKVAAISIEELVAGSDEIVVATVTELAPESALRNQSVFEELRLNELSKAPCYIKEDFYDRLSIGREIPVRLADRWISLWDRARAIHLTRSGDSSGSTDHSGEREGHRAQR